VEEEEGDGSSFFVGGQKEREARAGREVSAAMQHSAHRRWIGRLRPGAGASGAFLGLVAAVKGRGGGGEWREG
jgi:hypothetical protein